MTTLFVWFNLVVAVAPLAMGLAYLVHPSEHRLSLMRPLSLAAVFGALSNLLAALANALRSSSAISAPDLSGSILFSLVYALVPTFVAFSCLTVAWLCVALGLRKNE